MHRFSRHEVYRLCDEGWFADQRVNLIHGRIVVMPLPGPEHDFTVETLIEYLQSLVPAGFFVRSEKALGVDDQNDPGPDAAVIPGSRRDYLHDHPRTALFTAEVSKSTLKADLKVKPAIYARAGVPEYWVLDLAHRQIIVHREPAVVDDQPIKSFYRSIATLQAGDMIAPLMAPDRLVPVSALLPPQ